ncbi:MAG: pilus assembly protein [Hyphomicrobiales bacterium]|nr:pilus assembly protein [Hyphomicrobiales bacterium]
MFKRFMHCRKGASAVEFAIVAPVFLAILLGIVVVGTVLLLQSNVQQLAAEAARASVPGLNQQERERFARNYIDNNLASYSLMERPLLKVSTSQSAGGASAFQVTVTYDVAKSRVGTIARLIPGYDSNIQRSASVLLSGMGG